MKELKKLEGIVSIILISFILISLAAFVKKEFLILMTLAKIGGKENEQL